MDFLALAQDCAPQVHPVTMAAVARAESDFNPYAIGVVGGRLARQPHSKAEAVATAQALQDAGWNFSLGLGQVNRHNLAAQGLTLETAFDACPNLKAGSSILQDCYSRARKQFADEQHALKAAFSCYYSGDFTTGFKDGYVHKVLASADAIASAIPVIPTATPQPAPQPQKDSTPTPPSDAPVVLQVEPSAVPPTPRKPSVPGKYDGYHGPEESPFDGYSSDESE